jgi:hypothetical protein
MGRLGRAVLAMDGDWFLVLHEHMGFRIDETAGAFKFSPIVVRGHVFLIQRQ